MTLLKRKFVAVLAILMVAQASAFTAFSKELKEREVMNYTSVFIPVLDRENRLYIAIRTYLLDKEPYFLVVDPNTLQAYQRASSDFKQQFTRNHSEDNSVALSKKGLETPYYKALQKYDSPPYELHGHGLKHAQSDIEGVFLTIDMCPSRKPFEKDFYEALVKLAQEQKKPLAIAIAITNVWVLKHKEEFEWLCNQKWLDITWVNHSYSHPYYPERDLKENFLNAPGVDIMQEILAPEEMLISHGLTPSPFFRFPGLVSSASLIQTLYKLGLIPLSSNAWLAKGEKPERGSIILVHGNSNEHEGIDRFMAWSKKNKLPFLPLHYAIVPSP